ncbi:MAG: FtsX-like permease family protein [Lachnospiraceae bacterium]
MGLAYKQLLIQIARNRIFVFLLLLLTTLTSLSFFFAIFSIDGNMAVLNAIPALTENQQLYKNALNTNTTLAYNFLASLIGLTAFVFVIFFYRFYRSNKRQIGCMKALGFKDNALRSSFVVFTAVLSIIGAVLGLIGGYFLSSVLISANTRTYLVTGLVKGVGLSSFIVGILASTVIFCITAFFCYSFVRDKEPGVLIAGNSNHICFSVALRVANRVSGIIPIKNKFPLRIALRKPLAVLLIVVAVMSFSVCMIIGRSLNISSQKVFESQTIGHNYEYDTRYSEYQINPAPKNVILYLDSTAKLTVGSFDLEQTMFGLYNLNNIYELQNIKGVTLSTPDIGKAYINPGLSETYGVNVGDTLIADIAGAEYAFTVTDIAANAKSSSIYINANELSEILGLSAGCYNGVLSMEKMPGGAAVTKAERIEELDRNAVSNNVSGVINQAVGCIVGVVLIFLALYVNFQDNTRDMLILHMMGYRIKNIRKLLIDVYMPIVWTAFLITLAPSILLASSIQKSLSISTNDYMPFGTNINVVLIVFILLNIIYWLVQTMFGLGIKRTIAKEEISEFIYAE